MDNHFERWINNINDFMQRMNEAFNAMNISSTDTPRLNALMYKELLGEDYQHSFVNPEFADYMLGAGYGKLCSCISAESYAMAAYKFDKKSSLTEPFFSMIEDIKRFYESGRLTYDVFYKRVYEYLYDGFEPFLRDRVRDMLVPRDSVAKKIITGGGLGDVTYLYKYGEYITENDISMARYLNLLSKEKINQMASVFTEGYKRGFETTGRPFKKKKTVGIIYRIGFERLVKSEIEQFKEMGLETTLFRDPKSAILRTTNRVNGFFASTVNHQADYDHARDSLFFLDENMQRHKLDVVRKVYDEFKSEADTYGGPAVMEVFGEEPFDYIESSYIMTPTEKQKRLSMDYMVKSHAIINEYIKGEERSFTIIAYPTPEIGDDFKEIFNETVKLNTLDNDTYIKLQEIMTDVLNKAKSVRVLGADNNETDITVALKRPSDLEREENFENCTADVNIPLGEVFTSPVLAGTTGILHVGKAFLNGYEFRDLKIIIEDGMVKDYGCSNFSDEYKGREYFKKNVLFNHDTLPVGEFAIGTNTVAYAMAKKYNIGHVLPILIAEKCGPHFALGDTCYAHAEDVKVYNPNGKEIIAKDNEISENRYEDASKAYFNCHTDIPIPYEEIGSLSAVLDDGSIIDIIKSGRFVLQGLGMLNEALDDEY